MALPLGANTNLPVASALSVIWFLVHREGRPSAQRRALVALLLAPFASASVHFIVGPDHAPPIVKGALVFAVWALPGLVAFEGFTRGSIRDIQLSLRVGVITSAGLALAQYIAILNGRLPFVGLYWAPGYPPIEPLEESILLYSRRPFGWFPEPSFLAGTLVLGGACILLLRLVIGKSRWDFPVLSLAAAAMICSRSGVLIFGLIFLLPLVVKRVQPRHLLAALGSVAAIAWVASNVLRTRTRAGEWSWGDRYASVAAAARYWFNDPFAVAFGLGRDTIGSLYADAQISMGGLDYEYYPRGIYSISARYVLEGGILFGFVPIALAACLLFGSCSRALGTFRGLSFALLWLVVASLVTGYDTASVVWISLGLGLAVGGVREVDSRLANSK